MVVNVPFVIVSDRVEFSVNALPKDSVPPTASSVTFVVLTVTPLVVSVLLVVPRNVNVMPIGGDQIRLVIGSVIDP